MAAVYAAIDDVIRLGRKLTAEEQELAEALLPVASAKLSLIAKKHGKSIALMSAADPEFELAVKETIARAVIRAVNAAADNSPAATQASQAAMGYSISMSYLNAGQQLYYLRNELKDLGLLRQRWGALEVYGNDNSN